MGAVALVIYFAPAVIASARSHHNAGAIFALNLLLGWTIYGWVAAFVWSCTNIPGRVQKRASWSYLVRLERAAEESKQERERLARERERCRTPIS
jgi:Superinfection immunity protein